MLWFNITILKINPLLFLINSIKSIFDNYNLFTLTMNPIPKIELFRERISERLLLAATVLAFPAAIFSGVRIFTIGLKPLFIADILISLTLIFVFIFRKRISYKIRIIGVIAYTFLLGVLGLYTWGFFGLGFLILFFSCVIITTLFGLRYGFFLLSVAVLIISIFILSVHYHLISWDESLIALSNTTYQWVARLVFFISLASIAILSIGLVYKNLLNVTKEISNSENRFRSLFENANDAILILKDFHFIDFNPRALDFFQCSKEQMVEKPIIDFSPSSQPDGSDSMKKMENFIDLALSGVPQRFEWRLKRIDNSLIDVDISFNPIIINDETLVQAIVRDISDRKLLEQHMLMVEVNTEEKERLKLAGDLHDDVGPLLSSLNMYISLIKRDETQNKGEMFLTMEEIVKDTISAVREISNNLSPHVLNNYGLKVALNAIIEAKRKFVKIDFKENMGDERLPNNIEVIIYRLIKELMNNTLKHAKADLIDIEISIHDRILKVEYNDNGVGFDSDKVLFQNKSGIGLLNIIYRMNSLGADYKLFSEPGRGFRFEMRLNLDNQF